MPGSEPPEDRSVDQNETFLPPKPPTSLGQRLSRIVQLLVLLYLFLLAIAMMGAAFKLLGKDFAETLITATSNPVVGLMVGMLATAIIQSSSTTTSLIVGLVAAGAITVPGAIPMVMGANIGTTVTNTIVAMASMNRREEFRRSFAGATMHDFFNVISVIIILPLELSPHFLERMSGALATALVGSGEVEFDSPVKLITKPVAKGFVHWLEGLGWGDPLVGGVVLVTAVLGIFFVLSRLPRLMREMFLSRAEGAFYSLMTRGGLVGIGIGVFITVLVQSSSITTSLLVPMIGAGIIPLTAAFPITLGANIGTTVTALLASTAGTHDAVAIALVHLLFNISGILIIFPVKAIRNIPIRLAEKLADFSLRSRLVPILYLLFLFFLLPGLVVLGQRVLGN
jgi:sodium-dependent phosphate cotransporter